MRLGGYAHKTQPYQYDVSIKYLVQSSTSSTILDRLHQFLPSCCVDKLFQRSSTALTDSRCRQSCLRISLLCSLKETTDCYQSQYTINELTWSNETLGPAWTHSTILFASKSFWKKIEHVATDQSHRNFSSVDWRVWLTLTKQRVWREKWCLAGSSSVCVAFPWHLDDFRPSPLHLRHGASLSSPSQLSAECPEHLCSPIARCSKFLSQWHAETLLS